MTEKLTEARIKANKKWDENNKVRLGYLRHKARAKSFISKDPKPGATNHDEYLEDLLEIKKMVTDRIKEINQ
ncbi:hypothetical protein [Companilactobacillus nodensis]|uniref:Uncharacterized protein n=1 Tax=Companilactobacillus nodensis DSM 19682 = JCM 14932 = NBRC 107160 TaxID=1423775 RepID=A0A0R1K587_9LACO|nr:hypothetical protein [Companilactobacillus nodensis]KRK78742.1 hypothetical protein FD03_GL002519 [Companilactobacillus nodensis DSM 19682 = JCM 14932 = NBRC 107160]